MSHAEHVRNKKILRQEQREKRHNEKVSRVVRETKQRVHNATNISHTIPKCRKREGYDVEMDENKPRKPVEEHNEWHKVFQNKTPQEVIQWIRSFTWTILSQEADKKLQELEEMDSRDFYLQGMVK